MWYALIACFTPGTRWTSGDAKSQSLDPELKRIALSTFLVALFMFMDQTLGA